MTDTELILRCTQVVELTRTIMALEGEIQAKNLMAPLYEINRTALVKERATLLDTIRSECNWGK